jgi:hypothetical protein
MDIICIIAERKIQQALRSDFLKNNPYKGKKLQPENLNHIPEELRSSYIVLKNANVLPKEMQIKKDIYNIQQLLATLPDDSPDSLELKKTLTLKEIEFNILLEQHKLKINSHNIRYISKVKKKLKIG